MFFVDDRPGVVLTVPITADIDPADWDYPSVSFIRPDGTYDISQPFESAALVDGAVEVDLGEFVFNRVGVWTISASVNTNEPWHNAYAGALQLVVEEPNSGWQTLDSARALWSSAPSEDVNLYELLQVARQQVSKFAPRLDSEDPIPLNYRRAQLMQAQNIWTAEAVNADGNFGDGEYARSAGHPLDWHVKQMLRPKQGVPRVR